MNRILLLAGLAYGFFVVGLLAVRGGLVELAIPLIVFLAAAYYYGPGPVKLRLDRSLSTTTARPGQPVQVCIRLINEGGALEEVLVEDSLPPHLEVVEGQARGRFSLPAGGQAELVYTLQGSRCSFVFPLVQVSVSDHLGLFHHRARLPAAGRLTILPAIWRLDPVPIRPLRTRAYPGAILSRQGGAGVSFFGVRTYQLGDPLNAINWRKIARQEEDLFSNEFEQERVADVGIILDSRSQAYSFSAGERLFETAIQAAASLADSFLGDANRVGLLIYGRGREATFPGYGKVQRERILRALAQAEMGDNLALSSLENLPTRFFPSRSQIVLVSPLLSEDLAVLTRLRSFGYGIIVVCPDTVAFERRLLQPRPALELAVRIARVERVLLLRNLQRVGVQVVDWDPAQPLTQALRRSLAHAAREFRVVGGAA